MRFYQLCALVLLLLCGNTVLPAPAAKKPAKQPVKNTAAKPKPATQPTVQLPGDNGEFGTVYSLRKEEPLYFRMKSAEFTTEQVRIGKELYFPTASEKLLVIHFTIQNPGKTERLVRCDSLRFTAVDAMNVNHEAVWNWGDEKNKESVDMMFKPAQTLDVFTIINVPAKGIIPKLMVLPSQENDGPILRYDLKNPKNKVEPLSKYVADPSDPSGYTALETVPAELNVSYPYHRYDIKVLKFETVSENLGNFELEEGEDFFLATVSIQCEALDRPYLTVSSLLPKLISADGEELQYEDILLATANRPIERSLKQGDEITVRILFRVPKDATPKTFILQENDECRAYSYEVN